MTDEPGNNQPRRLEALLVDIDHALDTGAYMTGANEAFRELCARLGYQRRELPTPRSGEGQGSLGGGVDPDAQTAAWVRQRAVDFHHGNVGVCVAELLKSARLRDEGLKAGGWRPTEAPKDLWGPLEALIPPQRFQRKGQPPTNAKA